MSVLEYVYADACDDVCTMQTVADRLMSALPGNVISIRPQTFVHKGESGTFHRRMSCQTVHRPNVKRKLINRESNIYDVIAYEKSNVTILKWTIIMHKNSAKQYTMSYVTWRLVYIYGTSDILCLHLLWLNAKCHVCYNSTTFSPFHYLWR